MILADEWLPYRSDVDYVTLHGEVGYEDLTTSNRNNKTKAWNKTTWTSWRRIGKTSTDVFISVFAPGAKVDSLF